MTTTTSALPPLEALDSNPPGISNNHHAGREVYQKIAANIARLTALGVQVHIAELDVSLPIDSTGQASNTDLLRQADAYRGIVRACLQSPGCTAIQTWGFTDKYSWIGSHSHGTRGAALPFDRAYKPKAAYESMVQETAARESPFSKRTAGSR